jgi:hypothetical protein
MKRRKKIIKLRFILKKKMVWRYKFTIKRQQQQEEDYYCLNIFIQFIFYFTIFSNFFLKKIFSIFL